MGIDHLSPSAIRMYKRCPKQYEYRYLYGMKVPPSGALHLGTSFHKTAEDNHRQKLETQIDLPKDELEDRFSQAFESVPRSEIRWEEAPGRVKDDGSRLVGIYAAEVAPTIQPVWVEQEVIVPLENAGERLPSLVVRVDLTVPEGIKDLKTTDRSPSSGAAHSSDQLTSYSVAYRSAQGQLPRQTDLEFFIRPTQKHPFGRYEHQPSRRSESQLQTYLEGYRATASQIQHSVRTGSFPYTDPDNWWCSESMCGYWFICPGGFAQRTQVAVSSDFSIPNGAPVATGGSADDASVAVRVGSGIEQSEVPTIGVPSVGVVIRKKRVARKGGVK